MKATILLALFAVALLGGCGHMYVHQQDCLSAEYKEADGAVHDTGHKDYECPVQWMPNFRWR